MDTNKRPILPLTENGSYWEKDEHGIWRLWAPKKEDEFRGQDNLGTVALQERTETDLPSWYFIIFADSDFRISEPPRGYVRSLEAAREIVEVLAKHMA